MQLLVQHPSPASTPTHSARVCWGSRANVAGRVEAKRRAEKGRGEQGGDEEGEHTRGTTGRQQGQEGREARQAAHGRCCEKQQQRKGLVPT
eukprot:646424-Rhodomonas_salina.4